MYSLCAEPCCIRETLSELMFGKALHARRPCLTAMLYTGAHAFSDMSVKPLHGRNFRTTHRAAHLGLGTDTLTSPTRVGDPHGT